MRRYIVTATAPGWVESWGFQDLYSALLQIHLEKCRYSGTRTTLKSIWVTL